MKKSGLYTELMKIPLSLMISLSSIFGYIMHTSRLDMPLFLTATAILLLACGGACLNNYQDRHIDRLFSRTRHRVLPSNAFPPGRALSLSATLIILGDVILYLIRYDTTLPLLGATAIFLYNGIYTPLKSRSILAIIPGAVCGMMPPLIGWSAAGGGSFFFRDRQHHGAFRFMAAAPFLADSFESLLRIQAVRYAEYAATFQPVPA